MVPVDADFSNANIRYFICRDFDHDGDVDPLAFVADGVLRGATGGDETLFLAGDGHVALVSHV